MVILMWKHIVKAEKLPRFPDHISIELIWLSFWYTGVCVGGNSRAKIHRTRVILFICHVLSEDKSTAEKDQQIPHFSLSF